LRALGADAVESVVSYPAPAAVPTPTPAEAGTLRHSEVPADVTEPDPRIIEALRHGDLHVAAFASSTAARATAALYGPLPPDIMVVAMGSRTAAACQRAGLRVNAVATEPGIYPLATAVVATVTASASLRSRDG
jgi:uroporphyrinogen III methyltransferase/synthase